MPNLTPEQLEIKRVGRETNESFIVDAKAGSGKTFILGELLVEDLKGSCLLMAFNRSIADECKQRFVPRLDFMRATEVQISTVHSHGLQRLPSSRCPPQNPRRQVHVHPQGPA